MSTINDTLKRWASHKGIATVDDVTSVDLSADAATGNIEAILARLDALESQVSGLKNPTNGDSSSTVKTDSNGNTGLNSVSDKNVTVIGDKPVTKSLTISSKSLVMKGVEIQSTNDSSPVTLTTTTEGDVSITGLTTSGNVPQKKSNFIVGIESGDTVVIKGSDFENTGYNSIEVGRGKKDPKVITIDGVKFEGELSNNAISIHRYADGAVMTISNCHFSSVSNVIRLTNGAKVKGTLNIINCTVDKWDDDLQWTGLLIMEDNLGTTAENCKNDNMFSSDKLTVNITNCYGPFGKIETPDDLATICGTQDANQVIYIWNNKEGFVPYSTDRYPTINIK